MAGIASCIAHTGAAVDGRTDGRTGGRASGDPDNGRNNLTASHTRHISHTRNLGRREKAGRLQVQGQVQRGQRKTARPGAAARRRRRNGPPGRYAKPRLVLRNEMSLVFESFQSP